MRNPLICFFPFRIIGNRIEQKTACIPSVPTLGFEILEDAYRGRSLKCFEAMHFFLQMVDSVMVLDPKMPWEFDTYFPG